MSAAEFYDSSSHVNRRRRATQAEMEERASFLIAYAAKHGPVTVRQLYYRAVVEGIAGIDKTEAGYTRIQRQVLTLRRAKRLRYQDITDATRWMRPRTFNNVEEALRSTAQTYRKALWADASEYVEVWREKDAFAGVILPVTSMYDVPLMVSRGFSSDTYLQSAAKAIEAEEKLAFIYQFGDHDPCGVWIAKKIEHGLRYHAPNAELYFERVAVTSWSLPSRPTKRKGNTHASGFVGESIELDAIPARQLGSLVRECIERHVDHGHLGILKTAEASERALLNRWAEQAGGSGMMHSPPTQTELPRADALWGKRLSTEPAKPNIRLCLGSRTSKAQLDGDSRQKTDMNGKPAYTAIVEWRDRALSGRFSDAVVALIREAHPGDASDGDAT
jgi:hypothetical protein